LEQFCVVCLGKNLRGANTAWRTRTFQHARW